MKIAAGAAGLLTLAVLIPATAAPAAAAGVDLPSVAELPGVPAARLLARGRVLVLRPHRLQVAVDGVVRREIAVRQPLDLAALPDVVGDPAFASRPAPGSVRLGAVLVQRPETVVEAGDDGRALRLELADTGGAGPARITGTRAALRLSAVVITMSREEPRPAFAAVAAGLRYLHGSDVRLTGVRMDGLGGAGRTGVPALRSDGGSHVVLRDVAVTGVGRGVVLEDAGNAEVTRFAASGLAGDALTVSGGAGARISGVRARSLAAAGVRLHDAERVALTDVRVATAGVALSVEGGDGVVVRGGELRGGRAAVRAVDGPAVVLDGVTTAGPILGATVAAPQPGKVSRWRPVEGAGMVTVLVLAAAGLVELGRGRRRRALSSG